MSTPEPITSRQSGRYLVGLHVSLLLLGGTALFPKIIPLSAITITAWRSIIAFLALLLLIILMRQNWRLKNSKEYWIMGLLGGALTLHWSTYFLAIQKSTVAIGMLAMFTYPVMTVLLEPLINKTRLHWQDIASGLLVILGLYVLLPEVSLRNEVSLGIAWGVFSALAFSLRNIFQRKYFSHQPATVSLLYQVLIASLILLPWNINAVASVSSQTVVALLVLGVFFTAMPHVLFSNSLRYMKAKTVSLIGGLQPVYGTVCAAVILAEQPSWEVFVGGGIILGTAVYEATRIK